LLYPADMALAGRLCFTVFQTCTTAVARFFLFALADHLLAH